MQDQYKESWQLYKAHTESITKDLNFYLDFCQGHESLDLFAGYGRVANYLWENGVKVETLELSPSFSALIKLPDNRKHVQDVLTFRPMKTWDRIIVPYNSLSLLTEDSQIIKFLKNIHDWLTPKGLCVLDYFAMDKYKGGYSAEFMWHDRKVTYSPAFHRYKDKPTLGTWTDVYRWEGGEDKHNYNVRIYESSQDLVPFLEKANLKLVQEVKNFGKPDESEDVMWTDYIIKRKN